ncbi:hypothetical protein Tsubulata_036221 [Turnera subulata]|uniref:Pectinesterase n=1 Tax=Turnera subulata TaxID=218843 RepID=A0A9Q0GD38_9ROSI|nr:hypothetical protein Tsubulata_036221 [Turnera subulata]
MLKKITYMAAIQYASMAIIILLAKTTTSSNSQPIPSDKSKVESWFQNTIKPLAVRKSTLNSSLTAAEAKPIIIKVRKDGSGKFKTLTEAIASIPTGNFQRLIIDIGPGKYVEKLTIDRSKPFVTLRGSPGNKPILSFDGTAKKFGTVYSATLQVFGDFFVASNIVFENTAPKPDGKMEGAQAVALRIGGDKAAFYNCRFLGFQDTVCDDQGRHFFKDCYIQGTVDFIFGSGKSLYLNTVLNVVESHARVTVITAGARDSPNQDQVYSFVHCKVQGDAKGSFLGRPWTHMPRVVFAYTELGSNVHPEGWSTFNHPERAQTVSFGEYKCSGPGSNFKGRPKFVKKLTDSQAQPYLSLQFIDASTWLLPHPK